MITSIKERVLKEAEYCLQGFSIRKIVELMKKEPILESLVPERMTVYRDLSVRLIEYDKELFEKVRKQMAQNKKEMHLRGGEAAQETYRKRCMNKKRPDMS